MRQFPESAADGRACEPAEGDAAERRGAVNGNGREAEDGLAVFRFERRLRVPC